MSSASFVTIGTPRFWRIFQVRSLLRIALVGFALVPLFGVTSLLAQTYLENVGVPSFTSSLPVENGFINVSNGDLHLEIPLGTFPQRGGAPEKVVLMYDSAIWYTWWNPYTGYGYWYPTNIQAGGPPFGTGGWRLVTTGDVGQDTSGLFENEFCSDVGDYGSATYTPWIWTAPDGTQHSFNASTTQPLYPGTCPSPDYPTSTASASDGSGFYISITGYTNAVVYGPDGTQMGSIKTDPNGNQYKSSFTYSPLNYTVSDTLNRPVVEVTQSGTTYYFVVPNDQFGASTGGTSTYTVKTATVNVNTHFGETGLGIYDYSGSFPAITEIDLPDETKYQFSYDTGTDSGHYGLMTGMTVPTGGEISYAFTNFTDVNGNVSRWITKRTTPDSSIWTYGGPTLSGSCPSPYYVNCQQTVTVQKPSGDSAQYTFALNGGSWLTQAQYSDSSSVLATISACYNFVTLSTSGTCSYTPVSGGGATNVYRRATTTTLPVSGGGNISTTKEYTWDTSNNGNLRQISEWNFGSAVSGAADRATSITYLGGSSYEAANILNRPTNVTVKDNSASTVSEANYCYDYASGCGGTSSYSAFASATAVNHDPTYDGTMTVRGDLTQTQLYTTTSNYINTYTQYDIAGQVVASKDSNGNQTTYDYTDNFYYDTGTGTGSVSVSPTDAYLTKITYPAVGYVSFAYYWGTGQTAQAIDLNSQTTTFHFFDPIDRPTSTVFPDMGWTSLVYPSGSETQVDTYQGITSSSISTTCSTSGNNCRHDQTMLDSLGRLSSQILVSDPGGQDTVATTYDVNGRISTVSNPHRSSSASTDGVTTYSYDGLDRVTSVTEPDNTSVGITYFASSLGLNCKSVADEAGRVRTLCYDGFGRLTKVWEDPSTLNYETDYTYDPLNNLTSVSQSGSHSRTFVYDFLSRLTSVNDPESNTTSYSYTVSGSPCAGDISAVCQRTDARSMTTTYAYDALNRLTSKTYTGITQPTAYYTYDQVSPWGLTYSKGRLTSYGTYDTSTSSWVSATVINHDTMGRPLWTSSCVVSNTICKTVNYSYNYDGSIATLGYPSGNTITYTPNSAGQLVSAVDTANSINYATFAAYNPAGELSSLMSGNNNILSTLYYNSRLQPCRTAVNYGTTAPTSCSDSSHSGNVMDLSYNFNLGTYDNGNLVGFANNANSPRSESFNYDYLNRLTSAATTSTYSTNAADCWGETYQYDNLTSGGAFGNLTAIIPMTGSYTGCSQESGFSITVGTNNRISTSGFSYDYAGNMTGTPPTGTSFSYDAENQMTQASTSTTTGYIYDAGGLRVEKTVSGSATKLYWYDTSGNVLEEFDGSGSTIFNEYTFLGGKRVAQRDGSGNLHYYFQDNLGTSRILTDSSGNVCYDSDFYPFGGERNYAGITCTNYKFTGQERDSESNLDNFQARFFTSQYGRFMSPDPLEGDIGNPQSLNRYPYVLNNPETLTDPTGMETDCTNDAACGGCGDFGCGGIGIDLGDWSFPSPPPIYDPPNVGTTPNPSGDPDPNGPFSGPVWQEGGPQIPTTGNLYQILGLPNPPNLVFDANGPDSSQATFPQGVGGCLASFDNTLLGKTTKFFSPLSFVPGWNADFKQAYGELATYGTAKVILGEIATAGSNAFRFATYSLTNGTTMTLPTASEFSLAGKVVGRWSLIIPAAAGLIDVAAHSRCYAKAGAGASGDVVGP